MGEQFFFDLNENLNMLGDRLGGWLTAHSFNIVIILFGAWLLRTFSSQIINRALRYTIRADLYKTETDRRKRVETLDSLVLATLRVLIYVIAVVMIIDEIGIDTGPLIASAGVIGVAVGFGAQSLIKDFMSGIFIITENQYRVGDSVTLAGVDGRVEGITIRTTVLRDQDGSVHHIPNGTITTTTNKTLDFSRINIDVSVASGTDIDKLEHIINHVGEQLAADTNVAAKILEAPKLLRVESLNSDGVTVKITGKVRPGSQWRVKSELYKKIDSALHKNKIKLTH